MNELRSELDRLNRELDKVFTAAGDGCDLSKVECHRWRRREFAVGHVQIEEDLRDE